MIRRSALTIFLVLFSAVLFCLPAAAKEDTAQITLKKTAVSTKRLYTYTVKKGETLESIIKNLPGVTGENIPGNTELIKELNPGLADNEKLEAGQSLLLPAKPVVTAQDKPEEKKNAVSAVATTGKPKYYKIKSGDTLFKIIRRELKIDRDSVRLRKTLKAIKSINPSIKNINRIYAGSVIKLPGKTVVVKTSDETKPVVEPTVSPEKQNQPEKLIEVKEKKTMPPEARLAVLKQVITQMNGTMTLTGNYYLPIPKAGQVTIDLTKIPMVEFDDNTTVFLDLDNRAPGNLAKMISDNWKNFYLIKADKDDDVIAILKKVINSTKNYSMVKSEKPVVAGAVPPAEVILDWVIVKFLPQPQPIEGLRSIDENTALLPKSIKNYYQKNGFIINEISGESGIVGKPEETYALPPMPVFSTTSVKEFSYALVNYLGLTAEKDVDIQLFDTVKDGFNLAIKADVLVTSGDKKYMIYSQNLSPQFINALKQAGDEPIFVGENDSPKNNMENILRGLNIPFTPGSFTFAGLEKNQAPYTLKFNGTRINQDLYVVDFDIDQDLRGLLKEVWSANIARY